MTYLLLAPIAITDIVLFGLLVQAIGQIKDWKMAFLVWSILAWLILTLVCLTVFILGGVM